MRQKVAAALEQAEALEAKIDSKQAEHDRALTAMNEDKSALQRKLAEAQIASHNLGLDLQAAQQKAARQDFHLKHILHFLHGRSRMKRGWSPCAFCQTVWIFNFSWNPRELWR